MKINFFYYAFTLFILMSCSSNETDSGVYTKSIAVTNSIQKILKKPWIQSSNDGSDFALFNNNSKSFFLFNSACRKFEASNLNTLTASILTGINDVEYIDKNKTTFEERDAMLVTAKGSIDGVVRFFKILTVQKNSCIYDLALISTSKKNLEADTDDFKLFTGHLKIQ